VVILCATQHCVSRQVPHFYWLCAAYQVVKNPSPTVTDTHPQLTVKGIGYVRTFLYYIHVVCT